MEFGGSHIIGQKRVRDDLQRILDSGRIHHAYLFSGPPGAGKKALALAFAEAINGISNFTDLGATTTSAKRSWYHHPDIQLFIPLPRKAPVEELKSRIAMLSADPYDIVDFGLRPWLSSDGDTKNRQAFYSTEYFSEHIRRVAFLKPHEAPRNIIVLSNIERMRADVANSFLKILEEPPENLIFLLTTDHLNSLLPTIISRCHLIKCNGLSVSEIEAALAGNSDLDPKDIAYLARVSGGNYSLTRFFDIDTLRSLRTDVIRFLRASYTQDASQIVDIAAQWSNDLNLEGQISVLNTLEVFLRDILLYMHSHSDAAITNSDQTEVIKNFCESLKNARLYDMIETIGNMKTYLFQNANAKILFTVLSIRFGYLMRGLDTPIPKDDNWQHLPAIIH